MFVDSCPQKIHDDLGELRSGLWDGKKVEDIIRDREKKNESPFHEDTFLVDHEDDGRTILHYAVHLRRTSEIEPIIKKIRNVRRDSQHS